MKRSCKDIEITDWQTVFPWVSECLYRHKTRYDFRRLICDTDVIKRKDYDDLLKRQDKEAKDKFNNIMSDAAECIAKEACHRIENRNLNLAPVTYEPRVDSSSHKERLIGNESAMQQVFDYIAVRSCNNIWERRMVPQQISGFIGRGAIYGTRMIQGWILNDNRAVKYARKHHIKYSRKCEYFVKLDVKQCYPSLRTDKFLRLFERDCANKTILWLWKELLNSHKNSEIGYEGFMIGALCSQWACQYMLSFVYRHAMEYKYTRRNKKIKTVTHMVLQMDDLLLTSSSRKQLKRAVNDLIEFVREELSLIIKPDWQICRFKDTPIDIVGYKLYQNGKVSLRDRVFIRARRMILRANRKGGVYRNKRMNEQNNQNKKQITLSQAKRIASYEGYFKTNNKTRIYKRHKHSDCVKFRKKYMADKAFKLANNIISKEYKKYECYGKCNLYDRARNNNLYAVA